MNLSHESIYVIYEGSSEYPIRHRAKWLGKGVMPRFHVFQTIEISPRELTIHDLQIIGKEAQAK